VLVLVTGPPAAGKAALARGIEPLRLGGPILEVDTSRPVDVPEIATWVGTHLPSA
jgi:predicted kinase